MLSLLGTALSLAEPIALNRFALDAAVATRIAAYTVTLEFFNAQACTHVESLRLQHPTAARLSGLVITSADCVTTGHIEATPEATSSFEGAVARGEEGAIVHAYDLESFLLQVSIAPLRGLNVTISYEQALVRRNGSVEVPLPLTTGLPAAHVEASVHVHEAVGLAGGLVCQGDATSSLSFHYAQHDLHSASAALSVTGNVGAANGFAARVVCSYAPSRMPEEGVLLFEPSEAGGATFAYMLDDASPQLHPLPRRIEVGRAPHHTSRRCLALTRRRLAPYLRPAASTALTLAVPSPQPRPATTATVALATSAFAAAPIPIGGGGRVRLDERGQAGGR